MSLKLKLKRAIERSQEAYTLYAGTKTYMEALRIYKANKIIYDLLEQFVFECDNIHLKSVFIYLFHLEDWFEQFERHQLATPALDEAFVFNRIEGSINFPKDFSSSVLN